MKRIHQTKMRSGCGALIALGAGFFCFSAAAQTPSFPVDVWMSADGLTNEVWQSASELDQVTIREDTGGWSTSGSKEQNPLLSVSTNDMLFPLPINVGGTNYSDRGGGALLATHVDPQVRKYYSYGVGSRAEVSAGAFIQFGLNGVSYGSSDYLAIIADNGGGEYCVCNLSDTPQGAQAQAHYATPPGKDRVNPIFLVPGKIYWVTLNWRKNDRCRLRIYDPETWQQVGPESSGPLTDRFAGEVWFGRLDAVGNNLPGVYDHFDDVMINYTAAPWPFAPEPLGPAVGRSSGGPYSVFSNVSVSSAASSESGPLRLIGQIGNMVSVPPPVPAPPLDLRLTSTNTIVLSWPDLGIEFVLEQSGSLRSSYWTPVQATPASIGGRRQVVIPMPATRKFYRLRSP